MKPKASSILSAAYLLALPVYLVLVASLTWAAGRFMGWPVAGGLCMSVFVVAPLCMALLRWGLAVFIVLFCEDDVHSRIDN